MRDEWIVKYDYFLNFDKILDIWLRRWVEVLIFKLSLEFVVGHGGYLDSGLYFFNR